MSEELDRLWRLHELDERAAVLRARLARYPGERQALEGKVAKERARLEAHHKATNDVQLARRKLEHEVEGVQAEQRQFESRQPSVKTNEEYRALNLEIESCKAKRSDLETQVLLKFEQEERLAAERAPIEQALKAAEADLAARRAEIDREEVAEREKLAAIEAERAAEMTGLPGTTRQRYERIHASRDGRAVVAISKSACGGCFRQQPPQMLQEARRGERVLVCDGCGRLLVWPPGAA